MDDDTEFRFEVIGSKEIMIDDHLRSRIVGSIGNLCCRWLSTTITAAIATFNFETHLPERLRLKVGE